MKNMYILASLALASTLYVLAAPSNASGGDAAHSKSQDYRNAKRAMEKEIKKNQKAKWKAFHLTYKEKADALKKEKEAAAQSLKEANKNEWSEWKERYKNIKNYTEFMQKKEASAKEVDPSKNKTANDVATSPSAPAQPIVNSLPATPQAPTPAPEATAPVEGTPPATSSKGAVEPVVVPANVVNTSAQK